ncbi:MAG: aldo/keto reductase [Alphaproteobacteria bacterium]|nr:aldo/keto reductase [Alphaproteobacteria bacterium]
MEFATLNNGLKMPLIGMGTYPYNDDELKTVLELCWNEGYRLFDTAWLYQNEKALGEFLQTKESNEAFITSKVHANQLYYYYNPRLHLGVHKTTVKGAYKNSCQLLGVKQLNLYLLHAPFDNYCKLYTSMTKLYKQGAMKSIGVSNFTIKDLETLLNTTDVVPAVNQIEMNPLNSNRSLVDYCRSKGIVVEAFSPFGRGMLTKEIMDNQILKSIAEKYDKTIAQVVLRWLTQQGIVAIPRSNKVEKLRQNIAVFDFNLSAEDIDSIYGLNKDIHTVGGKIRIGND